MEALTEIEACGETVSEGVFNPEDLRDLQVLLDQVLHILSPFEIFLRIYPFTASKTCDSI